MGSMAPGVRAGMEEEILECGQRHQGLGAEQVNSTARSSSSALAGGGQTGARRRGQSGQWPPPPSSLTPTHTPGCARNGVGGGVLLPSEQPSPIPSFSALLLLWQGACWGLLGLFPFSLRPFAYVPQAWCQLMAPPPTGCRPASRELWLHLWCALTSSVSLGRPLNCPGRAVPLQSGITWPFVHLLPAPSSPAWQEASPPEAQHSGACLTPPGRLYCSSSDPWAPAAQGLFKSTVAVLPLVPTLTD